MDATTFSRIHFRSTMGFRVLWPAFTFAISLRSYVPRHATVWSAGSSGTTLRFAGMGLLVIFPITLS
jgi:hypothetical protein